MRKPALFFVILFFVCSLFSAGIVLAEGNKTQGQTQIKKGTKLDYSQYLAPKAAEAISASQGTLFVVTQSFQKQFKKFGQALIVDAERGIIVTTAHIAPEFPGLAYSDSTYYVFMFKKIKYEMKLKYVNVVNDLAVLILKDTEKKSLVDAGAKNVIFSEKIKLFEEYYTMADFLQFSEFGTGVSLTLPFKTQLIGIERVIIPQKIENFMFVDVKESFVFDKTCRRGFSGSGLFNSSGKVTSVIMAIDGGFSFAIPAKEVQRTIKNFYEFEEEDKKKTAKKAEESNTEKIKEVQE